MVKEETTVITRRTTRSSAATNTDTETTKETESYTPTINDLVFGGERLSFDALLDRFPARGSQIRDLVRLFGHLNSPMFPLFIYGGASTGKTSLVLQVLRYLNRPFVYASCRTCYSPRVLFESVLNQLLLHRKNGSNDYSSAKRCDKPSDFVNLLRGDLASVVAHLKSGLGKSNSSKLDSRPNGSMMYLIFDNLELVREWDKSASVLTFLFNLYDVLKMPELGIVFISNASPDMYYSSMGYIEPIPVYFPEYREEDIRQIFMRNQENRKLYSFFLDVVLRPFCRITRRVDELAAILPQLFKKYCEPLSDLGSVPNEEMKRRLFSHFQPYIAPSLNEVFRVSSRLSLAVEPNSETKWKSSKKNLEDDEDFMGLDIHMSTSAKYLLISAFIASRNPATLDASLFDSAGDADSRKRKRKASEKSMEQKETAEQEALLKGPGTFPLERLLAIFQCITSVEECSLDEEEHGNDVSCSDSADSSLMSDVLLQLSSLCNAKFIIKGGSCPLEGSTRYRSTISEDLALKVARSLKFPLPNYLYRR